MQRAITDQEILALIPRCQRGEVDAMEALYDLYADRLFRYLLARVGDPEVAADLTTELFLRVIDRIGRFRLNRQRPAASVSAWLYRIAANLAADSHRSRRRLPETDLDGPQALVAAGPNPERLAQQQETMEELGQAMANLSEDQRLVIVAKFGEGMSNAEVAAWLGKTEGAVKSLQHRALRTLGRLLGGVEL